MNMEDNQHRGESGFPVDQPMEALKQDHQFVKQLFERYLNTQDRQVKEQAGPQILHLLDMHTALEETIFYPRVHAIDASLVDQCEDEHEQAKQLMSQLRGRSAGDPSCDQLFRQLADAVLQHVDHEEHQLFPKVAQANLDLSAIGLEMQAFESNMVSEQAWASVQPGRR